MSFNITPVASGYQEIHPYSAMNIDSVKINISLIMMKEWMTWSTEIILSNTLPVEWIKALLMLAPSVVTPQNQYFPANAERMSVHCLELGCMGKYTPLSPRDFPRAGILHPSALETIKCNTVRHKTNGEIGTKFRNKTSSHVLLATDIRYGLGGHI